MSARARMACLLMAYVFNSAAFAPAASGERLPMHVYSTADGLAHNHVSRIRRDSRGFVWFCTDEGLSRWDGYGFKTYSTADGLPHAHVDDFLETRQGEYWIATDSGLASFHPERRSAPFSTYFPGPSTLSRAVNVLLEDRDGTVLVGTGDGLYRLEHTANGIRIRPEGLGFALHEQDAALVTALLLTRDGKLWAGTGSGIYARALDKGWRRWGASNRLPEKFINQLREGPDGRIWAGTRGGGLVQLGSEPGESGSILTRSFTTVDGLPSNDVRDFLISASGHIWAGTVKGLAEAWLNSGRRKLHFRSYSILDGLAEQSVNWFLEAPAGDLWVATGRAGAIRLSRAGFHTYTEADGFLPQEANQVMETRKGQLCIVNGDRSRRFIECFNGERFVRRNVLERPPVQFGFEWHQFASQNKPGEWWLATEHGALRVLPFNQHAAAEYISALPGSKGVWHVFQDSKKVVWLSEESVDSSAVVAWSPSSRTGKVVWREFWSPGSKRKAPSCFLEDGTGQIWIGLSGAGGLLRWRRDHLDYFGRRDGLPYGEITDLYQDRSGQLWAASNEGGLGKLDGIAAEHPDIRVYGRNSGLSSNEIWCITGDRNGRIYAGTGRGVDALDPAANRVVHYTADDGLVPGSVRACFSDRAGELWFVTDRGASRFQPGRELRPGLPRVLITEFRARGLASLVSQLGASQLGPFRLGPSQGEIAVDFLGIDSRLRGDLRYQYRLLGADASWSKPAYERGVTFASLAPRRYRFEVRALDVYGGLSAPAVAEFSISPAVWKRWWFRLLVSICLLGILYWLHRYRTLRLLELERVRTRIAADLHDDIGAGLSQIAVLTEVARTRINDGPPDLRTMLSSIGSVSRELTESMSDIVWSVNPHRDHLSDLVQRMRHFSSDVLSGANIDLRFSACVPEQSIRIPADVRREVYLIFKEGLNNVVRHSDCTSAEITVAIDKRHLELRIEDNGRGLYEQRNPAGNGLRNMAERARRIGGRIDVASNRQGGVRVVFQAPLRKR